MKAPMKVEVRRLSEDAHHAVGEQGRDEGPAEGEDQDVAGGVVARDEEGGLVGENGEQRLDRRQRPQPRQVDEPHRATASYSVRVCSWRGDSTRKCTRKADSKASTEYSGRSSPGRLAASSLLHAHVLAVGELDHVRAAERGEPGDDLRQRHVAGDAEVVDQRQGQDEVGPAPLRQRAALPQGPPPGGRGVADVDDQRQDRLSWVK